MKNFETLWDCEMKFFMIENGIKSPTCCKIEVTEDEKIAILHHQVSERFYFEVFCMGIRSNMIFGEYIESVKRAIEEYCKEENPLKKMFEHNALIETRGNKIFDKILELTGFPEDENAILVVTKSSRDVEKEFFVKEDDCGFMTKINDLNPVMRRYIFGDSIFTTMEKKGFVFFKRRIYFKFETPIGSEVLFPIYGDRIHVKEY